MKKILIVTCASFTAIVMLFALTSPLGVVPELNRSVAMQLFAMTLTIAVVMFLSERIEARLDITSIFLDGFIRVVICYAVVFIEGGLFGMFPFEWGSLADVSPVLVPTIIATYLVSYMTLAECASAINKGIRSRK